MSQLKLAKLLILLHDTLEVNTLKTCRRMSTLKKIYRGLKGLGSPGLNKMLDPYVPNHRLHCENQLFILPPKTKLKTGEKDIAIRGSYYWNKVPLGTKTIETIDQSKSQL